MDKSLLKEILSVPTYSTHEDLMRDYILKWAYVNKFETDIDEKGNVYIMKGDIEDAPCVVSHIDTVHTDQEVEVLNKTPLKVYESKNSCGNILYTLTERDGMLVNTGCGGDDKCGIFACLELINKFDNIIGAFFVEEEIGMNGSRYAVDNDILNNAGYFIQFDAPYDNWISRSCSGTILFDDKFEKILTPIWDKYDMDEPMHHPFTDIKALKLNYPVNCINYSAGYMNMHSDLEFVVLEYVDKIIKLGEETIITLGNKRYEFNAED